MSGSTKGPLLVCTGSLSCKIGSGIGPDGPEVLLIDTDRRTFEGVRIDHLLIGQEVVNGEGVGGNLNLARACYRKHMEEIATKVLGRPLVIILSDIEGATSVAGAVEINSLLVRVGLPSMVLLMVSYGQRKPSERLSSMANVLLDGPLRPGAMVELKEDSTEETGMTVTDILEGIRILSRGCSRDATVQVPATSLNLLRESGGPFGFELIRYQKNSKVTPKIEPSPPPSVMVMEVDKETTTIEMNEFLSSVKADGEGVHIGIIESEHSNGEWSFAILRPNTSTGEKHDSTPLGEMMSPEDILSSIGDMDMSPDMIM